MRILPARAHGVQFRQPSNVKARGVMAVIKSTDQPNGWTNFWGANYDWTFQQACIDHVAALGGTSIKTSPPKPPLAASGAAYQTAVDRLHKWCDYAASKGLSLYWSLGYDNPDEFPLTNTQRIATAVALAQITSDYPTTGIDLLNEPDGIGAVSAANTAIYAAAVFPAVRAVTSLPLTISMDCGYAVHRITTPTAWMTGLAPYVDYWDFHLYVLSSNVVPTIPGDLANFRASAYYKPFMFGEAGNPLLSAGAFVGGVPMQTSVFTMLTKMSLEPDCMGIYLFCLTDYDGAEFGIYDQSFTAARSQITDQFSQWRGVH